jgi:hypothetical protein
MAPARTLTPGYVVSYPNRAKAASKAARATVIVILLVSVVLMLLVTVGGWSKLEGLTAFNFAWSAVYLVIAFYVARWARGLLPIAAALGALLLVTSLISGTGATGTSWFDRARAGFALPQSLFGGPGLSPDTLGVITLALVPVQALLVIFAMRAFLQGWNVELEVPAA